MRFITPILGLAVMATVAFPPDSAAIGARSITDGASILAIRSFEHHAGLAPRSVLHGVLQAKALPHGSNLGRYEKRAVVRAWLTKTLPFAGPAKKQAAADLIEAHRVAKYARKDAQQSTRMENEAQEAFKKAQFPEQLKPKADAYDAAYKRTGAALDMQAAAELKAQDAAARYAAYRKRPPTTQVPQPLQLEAPP